MSQQQTKLKISTTQMLLNIAVIKHFLKHTPKNTPKNTGFTLIEISISLVVIGLIIGGVLVGRDLIHSAKLNKFYGEIARYKTVFIVFKTKYDCLPGDCANASNYFSGINEFGSSINGNGDGQIIEYTGRESHFAWEHLSKAGLIEGQYIAGSHPPDYWSMSRRYQRGYNTPANPYDNSSFFMLAYLGNRQSSPWGCDTYGCGFYSSDYDHVIITYDYVSAVNAPIAPVDAFRIDSKYDDGKVTSGKILSAYDYDTANCQDASNNYFTSTQFSIGCQMVFKLGF